MLLLRRFRDWRLGFLSAMLALMAVSELVLAVRPSPADPAAFHAFDIPALLVSVVALVAVAFYGRVLASSRSAETALRVEKAHLEQLFEGAPEGVVLLDNDGRVLRVNAQFTRLFGYQPSEVEGRMLDDLLAPAGLREEAGELTRRVAQGERIGRETVRRRKDGTEVPVAVLGTPVRVGGGQVAVYGTYRDITQRRAAEEALRVSEEKFSRAFRSSPDLLTLSTLEDGRFVDVNDTFVRSTGYARSEVLGRPVADFGLWVRPQDRERMVQQLQERGAVRNLELPFRVRSGEIRVALMSADIIEVDGQRCILTVSNDITEKKDAERALRQSEERYALAATGANDGLWDWDLKANEIYYSRRWKEMLGHADQEIGSSPDEWLTRIHRADVERVRAAIAAHLDGQAGHFESEHRMLCQDGAFRWMLSRGVAVRDATGTPYRMAGSQTDVTTRKVAEERLLHEAIHDPLTGLPNRALFMDLLARSVARGRRRRDYLFGVLFLDLDRFKVINDSLGHVVGDQLLVGFAGRLLQCVRPGDTVARLGGDEFTILLEDISDESDATRVAERIHGELQVPFLLDGHEVFTTASIGIALSATGYDVPDHILRDADTAMYRAKAAGKARHEVFDQRMHTRAMALLQLETDLRRGLERGEFRVLYQPIMCFEAGRIVGCEALLRWQHPERGLLRPGEFVPVAEETGLIVPIGQWALTEACRQVRAWQRGRNGKEPLSLSVNLSTRQFGQPDLIGGIQRTLEETGLTAASLKLEIREAVMMEYGESVLGTLGRLRDLGIELYIDDFGTGYSSFSALTRFPISTLKIDPSFIVALGKDGGQEIVRTIVTLAHTLELGVIAEGVETPEQLEQLKALGCDRGQGTLFSPPCDAAAMTALLRRPAGRRR